MSVPSIEALEAQFGNIGVADDFDGEIEPDDEPNGRTAVVYDDDPLLASPPPGGLSELASRAVHPGGGGGGGEALLARLEAMAAQLEAESGEPEPGIRAQISTLRAVLTGQKEEVKVQARRLAGMDAAGATAEASAAAERVEEGLARVDAAVSADPEAPLASRPSSPLASHLSPSPRLPLPDGRGVARLVLACRAVNDHLCVPSLMI